MVSSYLNDLAIKAIGKTNTNIFRNNFAFDQYNYNETANRNNNDNNCMSNMSNTTIERYNNNANNNSKRSYQDMQDKSSYRNGQIIFPSKDTFTKTNNVTLINNLNGGLVTIDDTSTINGTDLPINPLSPHRNAAITSPIDYNKGGQSSSYSNISIHNSNINIHLS